MVKNFLKGNFSEEIHAERMKTSSKTKEQDSEHIKGKI